MRNPMTYAECHDQRGPLTSDGLPYEGIAVHVRARAIAGDPAYQALWRGRTCFWCETIVDPVLVGQHRGRTFDHMVTKADRGSDEADNLRNSCHLCNQLRDCRGVADFRVVADMVIRPNRADLLALGQALLDWDLVREARVTWRYLGIPRHRASAMIFARLGADAFDPSSKRGFQDLVSVLYDRHVPSCAGMDETELSAALAEMPTRNDLRRLRTFEAADESARRDALAKALRERVRPEGDGTTAVPENQRAGLDSVSATKTPPLPAMS